eukprot:NODE_261_length_12589_cov_0.423139.p6 type:complete len:175 gc:universal NODE_261_length_12589_cov_0.423139:7187-7711(+)
MIILRDKTMSTQIMDTFTFRATIMDSNITVHVNLFNNYRVVMDFNWLNTLYNFDVNSWSGRGLTTLVTFFLNHSPRDPNVFGSISPVDGTISVTGQQKKDIILQACKDIFHVIDQVVEKHGRSLLDYAVWYRDKRANYNPSDYAQYITREACNCIVHGELLAPNVLYDLVQYDK